MSTITIHEFQRDPQAFIRRIEAGEKFLLVQDDQPLAEIRPVAMAAEQPRPFGLCAGRFTVPADFDQPLPDEVLKDFESS